ncbi:MAG: hypothetical protein SCARUB_05145 [Candidatus Scalindua rubra]|uniref:DUF5678 domain-containing protein n=1 Tax=Candidatus Scalindua rubra TaxID=1872076 RepID=A0A1E3X230_9BACT|nr:MAG: hypothetical protein SCARUB_05145 [Candidatus Scalindua rubra]
MLDKEFEYFLKHQDELSQKYKGKIIVIKGTKVLGSYSSELEAYLKTIKKYKLGTFLIQECSPGEEVYSHTFHSRVRIA